MADALQRELFQAGGSPGTALYCVPGEEARPAEYPDHLSTLKYRLLLHALLHQMQQFPRNIGLNTKVLQ